MVNREGGEVDLAHSQPVGAFAVAKIQVFDRTLKDTSIPWGIFKPQTITFLTFDLPFNSDFLHDSFSTVVDKQRWRKWNHSLT